MFERITSTRGWVKEDWRVLIKPCLANGCGAFLLSERAFGGRSFMENSRRWRGVGQLEE